MNMRQPRFTFPGAFHHCVNRGLDGKAILAGNSSKEAFLDMLAEKVLRFRIRLLAYCLMDTHYHLILQNSSGRMSEFFRNLNTQYAALFRKTNGGSGYVFQGRYKSALIGDDAYLRQALLYLWQNPRRAKLVSSGRVYPWSSEVLHQGSDKTVNWLSVSFVEELFGGRLEVRTAINGQLLAELPTRQSVFGEILGEENCLARTLAKFDRRHIPDAVGKRREDDFGFAPVEKVVQEFEQRHGVAIESLDVTTWKGKRLRGELLVLLRDQAGLTYREIIEFAIFSPLKYLSMSQLYRQAKRRGQ